MNYFKSCFSIICTALSILPLINSCHKGPASLGISDYPNKIGDQWIYFVQDSLNHINDTLTVTVVSSGQINGATSLLWQYAYSNGVTDTLQALPSGNTFNYYTYSTSPQVNFDIQFPLIDGSAWTYSNYATYSTYYPGAYSNLGHSFSNVYVINHSAQYPDYYLADNIYISSKIGIVYRKIHEIDFGPTINQTWTLINYHLN